MGTPEFAVPSLEALLNSGYPIVAVITAPDKPAGRGKQLRPSAVKEFALAKGLPILQPTNLKDKTFLDELEKMKASLQVVVAFRMLPEEVWSMPDYGTINLHASLLPQYRGAAPLNHVIINGESETGLTTFILQKEIDTGNILLQKRISIAPDENVGSLHDKMMGEGAKLLLQTVDLIREGKTKPINQDEFYSSETKLKPAPKIFKEYCKIDWDKPTQSIYNLIRGLSPYPSAFSLLQSPDGITYNLKIFSSEISQNISKGSDPGNIITDKKKYISVQTLDGWINILDVQLSGKKRMKTEEFLRGFMINSQWKFI